MQRNSSGKRCGKCGDENTFKGFPRAKGRRGQSQEMANSREARVQIEGAVSKAAGRTCRAIEQGCQVFSFKHPSLEELEHDFLWRTTRHLPERGRIGIFNRSYYEEVLIVRVHPEILRSQGLPEELRHQKGFWNERYRSIMDLEDHLHRNGTRVVKFFLHLSKGEQRNRFLARIDEPDRNWKFSLADMHERKYWKHYMQAYEDCLTATSTAHAPWYVRHRKSAASSPWSCWKN